MAVRFQAVPVALAALAAAGCGTAAPSPAATSASAAPATTVRVTQSGGTVRTPAQRVTVRRGAVVEVDVTSATADEFHLHGYDRELELRPGVTGVLRFVADQPGVFEAELHRSGARVFELRVD
jgi:FtsP/CotA-like multicopper oxidase with cupredoxin domain